MERRRKQGERRKKKEKGESLQGKISFSKAQHLFFLQAYNGKKHNKSIDILDIRNN